MRTLDIVVTGPRGAGKASSVEAIGETALAFSEQGVDGNGKGNSGAAVEMDPGRITISGDTMIYLFGTQGMEGFEFTWKAISEGTLGFVLMVDGSPPETFGEAGRILEYFRSRVDVPCVAGLTRVSETHFAAASDAVHEKPGIDEVRR